MRLGLIANSAAKAICEHTKTVTIGVDDQTEGVIVEHSIMNVNDVPCINTCMAVQNLLSRPDLQDTFYHELGIKIQSPVSYLYGFIGPKGFSDLLEVSYSSRFMAGNVGPGLGFVQGTAIPATNEIKQAFPKLVEIEKVLIELEYVGEITIGCAKDFSLCGIKFGHQTGLFSLFTELSQLSPQANYEWCLGVGENCLVHSDGVSVCTLISNSPFPAQSMQETNIIAPVGAERHLYRVQLNSHEIAFVSTWGKDVIEAKRRTRRTIENCVSFNPELQYRIDYGYKENFVFNSARYLELGGQ